MLEYNKNISTIFTQLLTLENDYAYLNENRLFPICLSDLNKFKIFKVKAPKY